MKKPNVLCLLPVLVFVVVGCGRPSPRSERKSSDKSPSETEKVESPPVEEPEPPEPVRKTFTDVGDALGALSKSAEDGSSTRMFAAMAWLSKQGPSAFPAMRSAILDDTAHLTYRRMVCRTLGSMGPTAVPLIFETLSSEHPNVRLQAVETLGAVKPTSDEIVSKLIELLSDDDPMMQRTAIVSLAGIGTPAKAAGPKLQFILNSDASDTLRGYAADALKKVNPRKTFED